MDVALDLQKVLSSSCPSSPSPFLLLVLYASLSPSPSALALSLSHSPRFPSATDSFLQVQRHRPFLRDILSKNFLFKALHADQLELIAALIEEV